MLSKALLTKKCLIVCGGGGVGKTTVAASLALAAAKVRQKVLVVTIDPSKRLAEAFGFTEQALIDGGEPLKLSDEVKIKLGLDPNHELSVGILNPKYVLEQVIAQTLTTDQAQKLQRTSLYTNLSSMIYGLQEYTAYEWVTRMIQNRDYDFIVLDTPPAAHAKDFFNVPERVKHLMESKVFQIFLPKKKNWFTKAISFGWLEKLLGDKIFNESKVFFEIFTALRDRVLERCELLSQFFSNQDVAVVTVATTETSGQFELRGLYQFLQEKRIPLQSILLNQVEMNAEASGGVQLESEVEAMNPVLYEKLKQLRARQSLKSDLAKKVVMKTTSDYPQVEVVALPMVYSESGFEILKRGAEAISKV
jgi:anion-transporting  ArsA/GET3 family ATPase